MSFATPIRSVSLTTERLILRTPETRDFEAFVGFVANGARSHWVGGPGDRDDAREGFADNLAHWARHGFGYFHVEERATGAGIGRVGIRQSDDRPEPELAYSLYEDRFEGRGLAREAAVAVRDWAYDTLGLTTLVSYVDRENSRSIALAEAVGARLDGAAPGWRKHPDLAVYRHLAPEARG